MLTVLGIEVLKLVIELLGHRVKMHVDIASNLVS